MSADATAVPLSPPPPKDPARQATVETLLTDIFRMMEHPARVELKDAEDGGFAVAVHFEQGPPLGVVPGKKSHLVDCVQFLINKATNRPNTERRWVSLGVGGFPEARPLRGVPNPGQRPQGGPFAPSLTGDAGAASGNPRGRDGRRAAGGTGANGNGASANAAGADVAGGSVAGGNVAGGNVAGGNVAGGNVAGGNVAGGNVAGGSVAAARAEGRPGRNGRGGAGAPAANGPRPSGPAPQGRREPDEASLAAPPNPALEKLGAQLAAKSVKYGRHLAVLLATPEARASMLKGAAGTAEVTVRAEGEQYLRRLAFVPAKPAPMPKKNALPIDDDEE